MDKLGIIVHWEKESQADENEYKYKKLYDENWISLIKYS